MTCDELDDGRAENYKIDPALLEQMAVFGSILGLLPFDAAKVAEALRSGTLSKLETIGLANLIEGNRPDGLRLVMQGQGKGWRPLIEKTQHYYRVMAVGAFVRECRDRGLTAEEAVIDAGEHFALSEPTIWRDLRLYEIAQDLEV